jgi:hypothetical protein
MVGTQIGGLGVAYTAPLDLQLRCSLSGNQQGKQPG